MVYRAQCLGLIDGVSQHDEDEFALYGYGSEPMTDSGKAIPLETLLARLDKLSEQIAAALEEMPESPLGRAAGRRARRHSRSAPALQPGLHEAYHVGQLEPLYEMATANHSGQ